MEFIKIDEIQYLCVNGSYYISVMDADSNLAELGNRNNWMLSFSRFNELDNPVCKLQKLESETITPIEEYDIESFVFVNQQFIKKEVFENNILKFISGGKIV